MHRCLTGFSALGPGKLCSFPPLLCFWALPQIQPIMLVERAHYAPQWRHLQQYNYVCVYKKIICNIIDDSTQSSSDLCCCDEKKAYNSEKTRSAAAGWMNVDWSQLCQHNDLTYYAPNYAGIICQGLLCTVSQKVHEVAIKIEASSRTYIFAHVLARPSPKCLWGGFLS